MCCPRTQIEGKTRLPTTNKHKHTEQVVERLNKSQLMTKQMKMGRGKINLKEDFFMKRTLLTIAAAADSGEYLLQFVVVLTCVVKLNFE